MSASVLFTSIKISSLTIPNRFVRSGTHDFMAGADGSTTERNIALFAALAEGRTGLLITGHAFVNPAGKASPRQIGVHEDDMVKGLNRIVGAVHRYPSTVFLQISHAGRQTKEKICGCTPLAPSAVYEPMLKIMPKAMTKDDIETTINDFIKAGWRAQQAGFDGVQLHVAHGYLLSSFLSPHTNRRDDDYGGSLLNRSRIVRRIVEGLRSATGPGFPVIAKLNSSDFLPGGLEVEESIEIARLLESSGLDGVEVSGGTSESGRGSMWPGLRLEDEEGYFIEAAARFKAALRIPVFGLGGLRTLAVMERAVEQGKVDLISLSRPLIREPDLVRRFQTGQAARSECISCNKCLNPRGIRCGDLEVARRKKEAQAILETKSGSE